MGKIVAIGGGEISKNETLFIDKFIISLSNKTNPKILFISTASNDAKGYIEFIIKYFTALKCTVDSLCLINENLSDKQIKDKILSADIIYVGGGNTKRMMDIWQKHNIDIYLKLAYEKGIVLSGLSAGSICWFNWGCSAILDSHTDTKNHFDITNGLGILNFAHCVHYNNENAIEFDNMINKMNTTAIALEDLTALVEIDGKYSIIKADKKRSAFRIKGDAGNLIKKDLPLGVINI